MLPALFDYKTFIIKKPYPRLKPQDNVKNHHFLKFPTFSLRLLYNSIIKEERCKLWHFTYFFRKLTIDNFLFSTWLEKKMNKKNQIDFLCSEYKKITGYPCFYIESIDQSSNADSIPYIIFPCMMCMEINKSKQGHALCEQKRKNLLDMVIRNKEAESSFCHAGCVEIAAPLYIKDELQGVFICIMPPINGTDSTIEEQRTIYQEIYHVSEKVFEYYRNQAHLTNRFIIEPAKKMLDSLVSVIFNYKVSENYKIMHYKEDVVTINPFVEKTPYESLDTFLNETEKKDHMMLSNMMKDHAGHVIIRNHLYRLYVLIINGELLKAQELTATIVTSDQNISFSLLLFNTAAFLIISNSYFSVWSEKADLLQQCCQKALISIKKAETVQSINIVLSSYIHEIANALIIKLNERHMVITRIAEYVNSHYYEDIKLNDIAKEMKISIAYASRLFKQQRGVNFRQYLLEVRMYYAYRYLCLVEPKQPIKEIAQLCGYQNIRAFYAMFKKYYGCSCNQLRAMYKNKDAHILMPPTLPR